MVKVVPALPLRATLSHHAKRAVGSPSPMKFLADDDVFQSTIDRKKSQKMPSHRMSKVQKHITKKKGKNVALHENSRDTRRLQSAAQRDDKINRLSAIREKQNRPYRQWLIVFRFGDPLTQSSSSHKIISIIHHGAYVSIDRARGTSYDRRLSRSRR